MTLLFTKLCRHLCLLAFTLGCAWLQAEDLPQASLNLYVFEAEQAVEDYQVWMDKGIRFNGSDQGAVNFQLSPGEHQLVVNRNGFENAKINLNVSAGEYLEIIVTQYKGNPVSHISLETSKQKKVAATQAKAISKGEPGMVKGRIISSENQQGVAGARLFFAGFAQEFITDKDGYFQANVPASQYSVSIVHNSFATQTLDGIEVSPKQTLTKNFELTPAGIALKEFVVVAPFIQGSMSSLVDERKETTVMSDFVGAEQMSKSGDSDAAAALTRVAGLTLIDGKYAVVRGMEDRYTTVLMNGAVMRSPDPNSKSVDLDLFPASILDSIEVQKTYSADAPGAFGGGLIKLRTKSLPEEDFFKIKVSTGGNLNFTGDKVISQESGDSDWLGIDDGGREHTFELPRNAELTDEQSKSLPVRFETKKDTANQNLEISSFFGQIFNKGVFGKYDFGYQGYVSFSNKWDYEEGINKTYAASGDVLTIRNDQTYQKSKFSSNITALLNFAVENTDLAFKSTTALIRKSYRLTSVDEGIDGENGEQIRDTWLEWSERELLSQQFNGYVKLFESTDLNWRYGFSNALLYNPDTISYTYDDSEDQGAAMLSFRDRAAQRRTVELKDENQTFGFDIESKFNPSSFVNLKLKGGYSFDLSSRSNTAWMYQYNWKGLDIDSETLFSNQNPNKILNDTNIGSSSFVINNYTSPSDSYNGERETNAVYGIFESTWFNDLDIILGIRNESFIQTVNAFDANVGDPLLIEQSSNDSLPSLLATYRMMDGLQFRLAMAETINRASMLELSPSSWIDPISGDRYQGNPRLNNASITHFDARVEMYGAGSNSISLAYFSKDFTNPIEKTLEAASGGEKVVTYQNATSGTSTGLELDFRYDLTMISSNSYAFGLAGNYASIASEVVLPAGNIEYSDSRPMQGQSPYTMNLMATLDSQEHDFEAALIFNEIGERISRIGQGSVPHVYEQPFSALDFTLSKNIDDSKLSFKLKNILDESRLFKQGNKIYKKYNPGVEFNLSYEIGF